MTTLLTANFNDTLPVAPVGRKNVKFQADPPTTNPRNISAYGDSLGGVDARISTAEIVGRSSSGKLVTLNNASPVAVTIGAIGLIQALGVNAGGASYAMNDTFSIGGAGTGATGKVLAVSSGAVTAIELTNQGRSYLVATGVSTTATLGSGTGLTIDIFSIEQDVFDDLMLFIENIGAGTATLTPGSGNIDGASTLALSQNQGSILFWDGTNWRTVRGLSLPVPVPVTDGGTGDTSLTAHGVLIGEGTSAVAAAGPDSSTDKVLTANGTGSDPSFKYALGGRNAQTGTTYTLQQSDRGKVVTLNNGSAVAVTLPNANTLDSTFLCFVVNLGAGTATLTPTTSTIDGLASLALTQYQAVALFGDGTNYVTDRGASSGSALPDPVTVAHGGTGDVTLTAHGVLIGEGTSAVAATSAGTSGQVLTSNGASADPTFQTPAAAPVTSVFGRTGAVVAAANDYTEAQLSFSNITTNDVTSTKHGFAPVSPADATKFLNGAATPAYAAVKDSDLSTSNVTANDVSTAKHGFAPKGTGTGTKYLDDTGAYSTVPGTPGGGSGTGFPWGGDGSDGVLDFDGTNTFSGIATTTGAAPNLVYSLVRDIYPTTLTVESGKTLKTVSFRIFASVSVTVNGTLRNNGGVGSTFLGGNSAENALAGTLPLAGTSTGTSGGAGGAGSTTNGSQGAVGATGRAGANSIILTAATFSSWNSGKGGDVGANTGGAVRANAGTAGITLATSAPRVPPAALTLRTPASTGVAYSMTNDGGGAGGGGGGAGDGTNVGATGGGGGGSGGNGGFMAVAAPTITVGGSGVISVNGGDGVAGSAGNNAAPAGNRGGGGGGGGGQGGIGGAMILIYHTLSNGGTIQAAAGNGGAGGNGGTGTGTGAAGANGQTGGAGTAGLVIQIVI
jgi:hypothetical protein